MKIGHSNIKSETFLPKFVQAPNADIVYVDIAGLNDTAGYLMELINCFITKELFKRSKHVRFLVAISMEQVNETKGKSVRDLINTLQYTC